ncbi:hypothetical protein MMC34_001872 [Xylographa carneopallida]|nr:hypothetical protein [Xylographa carneopallida]
MSATPVQPLRWSTQLKLSLSTSTQKLQGDKIILPPSALEQLLAAATVTVPSDSPSNVHTDTFDPFNPHSYVAERQARLQPYEIRQQLPQPLTFRIVNPQNGNIAYAGVREFSAEEDHIGLSQFLRQALGFKQDDLESVAHEDGVDAPRLTVHVQQLPKGTFVRLRPLESGYDPEDWKALLERHMRDTYTTLTKGEILSVPSGKDEYRFLIDKVVPEGDGICIVDTDLEVDIEALNEEQARDTLKRRLEKTQRAPGSRDGSSGGGNIWMDQEKQGQVLPDEYVDYTLKEWDRSKTIDVTLNTGESDGMVDMFVTPYSAKQRARPRDDTHVFGDMSERPSKKIRIQHSNSEIEGAEALWVAVRGYRFENKDAGPQPNKLLPLPYSLRISVAETSENNVHLKQDYVPPSAEESQCKNCLQWVPKRTMVLHESFCYRNNILCPKCQEVFQKSSPEWKHHWHCPHDDAHGNTYELHSKHDDLFHVARVCKHCGFEAKNISELAHHRTTTCPGKLILCQFCHLLVPQQGPEDPSVTDSEVIFSGLTPHELIDGARTTECHMCGKIVRLRDMATHLKHHDLERLSRITPRTCRNTNCGRTLDGVGPNGDIRRPKVSGNDIGLCETCYGPLYNNAYDPEGKALRRRVERRYLTQLLTGCDKDWCRNEYCKTGRRYLGLERPGEPVTSKEAMGIIRPALEYLGNGRQPLHFCTDEASQKRRVLADMIAAEGQADGETIGGYDLPWCIAALEAEGGDLGRARSWLKNWAPTRAETSR